MTMIYLFDTNIIVEVFRQNAAIMQRINQLQSQSSSYSLNATTVGELFYGAYHSKRDVQTSLTQVTNLIQTTRILACDANTANMYGEIRESLSAKGQMIPENDIWIAASAKQYNLTLATRDAHFSRVDGLLIDQW